MVVVPPLPPLTLVADPAVPPVPIVKDITWLPLVTGTGYFF